MATESDTKPVIDRLWEEYNNTTDPVRRAEIKDDIEYLAGDGSDCPGLLDDD